MKSYKKYKMNMTRPEFLSKFLPANGDKIMSFEELKLVLPELYDLVYCTYTALMEADIMKEDIDYVSADEDNNVVVKLYSKSMAKTIRDLFKREFIHIGEKIYKIGISTKASQVFISVVLTNPEVLHETIIGPSDYEID